jgi:hypothetical protein
VRPYLAVIKDSFREAFASRVLWILLFLIVLLLALIAPLGYQPALASRLSALEITDLPGLIELLARDDLDPKTPDGQVIARLSDEMQRDLRRPANDSQRGEARGALARLVGELNGMLEARDFYDEAAWADVKLGDEARELQKRGLDTLPDDAIARFNRLAFDAAFAAYIRPAPPAAVQLAYLGWEFGDPLPLSDRQLQEVVGTVVAGVTSRLVGNIGVFIALLVTASIVPQMLDAGACDLLLSKPVARPLLFLSKFLGGCAFILLNAAFLNTGLWLIVGLRFGAWNSGLLWAIPVFVFVFAVYYSVSTIAGVIWRSAVVSIVISILFWALCFTVGIAKGTIEGVFLDQRRAAAVIPAGESLLVTRANGSGYEWQASTREWTAVFEGPPQGPVAFGAAYPWLGPVYDEQHDRLVALSLPPAVPWFRMPARLNVAERRNGWKRVEGPTVPGDANTFLLDPDGTIIVAGVRGVYRFEGDPTQPVSTVELFGVRLPTPGGNPFVRIDGDDQWQEPFAAALDSKAGELAVISGDSLHVLSREEVAQYTLARSQGRQSTSAAVVGIGGGSIVIAARDGKISVYKSGNLEERQDFQPFGGNTPKAVVSSPDGRWLAVLFHHRRLWCFDTQSHAPADTDVDGQGEISAVAFAADNTLYMADGFGRVTQYDPAKSFAQVERWSPQPDTLERVYAWGVRPLYTAFPKPGEMQNLVSWLMTRQETATAGMENDMSAPRVVLDVWTPLWSNLAFLGVMLGLTCVYLARKDF